MRSEYSLDSTRASHLENCSYACTVDMLCRSPKLSTYMVRPSRVLSSDRFRALRNGDLKQVYNAKTGFPNLTTRMTEQTKPFPGDHPVHSSEIVPAAVLVNTFLHATSASELSNICLRVPVTMNNPREIQVTVRSNEVKICSRWIHSDTPGDSGEPWVTHTTSNWSATIEEGTSGLARIPIEENKSHIGAQIPNGFSIDYLSSVGGVEHGISLGNSRTLWKQPRNASSRRRFP